MPTSISEQLRRRAVSEGFSAMKIASANGNPATAQRLRHFISHDYHGDMDWFAATAERRASPKAMWPEARTAIVFAMNYGQGIDALQRLDAKLQGVISVYALNRDYHDVIKGKLKKIATWFARTAKAEVKVFVDTAPLMEKPLAHAAGLGGKASTQICCRANWGRGSSSGRSSPTWLFRLMRPRLIIAAAAMLASISVLPGLFRHPINSMRDAAFPISRLSIRAI